MLASYRGSPDGPNGDRDCWVDNIGAVVACIRLREDPILCNPRTDRSPARIAGRFAWRRVTRSVGAVFWFRVHEASIQNPIELGRSSRLSLRPRQPILGVSAVCEGWWSDISGKGVLDQTPLSDVSLVQSVSGEPTDVLENLWSKVGVLGPRPALNRGPINRLVGTMVRPVIALEPDTPGYSRTRSLVVRLDAAVVGIHTRQRRVRCSES